MQISTVDLITANLRNGDATSHHTFDLVRLLQREGYRIRIVHNYTNGDLPEDIRPLVIRTDYAHYRPAADLTILQYPVWFPLAERFRQAPKAAIFWYHGVTPPRLWGDHPGVDLLETSEVRTALAWYAHLAVCASPFTAAELHDHSGYPRDRIRVAPLTVDVADLAQPPAPSDLESLRRRWHLADRRVLLYIGRIAGNKRIDLLIRALAELGRPDVRLVVVGDITLTASMRSLHGELMALAQELGVADQVIFTGRVPAVGPYLHLAELCLLPSQHEGFGVPVVEAMAAGKPVIASDSGALPWVLGEEEPAGLLFSPGEVGSLVAQIARLMDDSTLAQELARRGQQRARTFDAEHFAANVNRLMAEAATEAEYGSVSYPNTMRNPLSEYADIALRDYTVQSGAPVVGRLIEWVRRNLTSHLKEPYVDRIVERQINYNHMLASQLAQLQAEVEMLRAEVEAAREASDSSSNQ